MSIPPSPLTVVGSINEDVTLFTEALPRPGETVLATSLRRSPGGKGANQAAAAARLGGGCRMIGAVGTDEAGSRMLAALETAGVDTSGIARVDAPTGQAQIVVDAAGENTIVVVPGANQEIRLPADLPGPVLCQLEIPMPVVLAAARATDGFFALNAAPARELPAELVEACDLVIVNETEYRSTPALAAAPLVVVTLGAAGAIALAHGAEVGRSPAPNAQVVSSVGAGDAFCAALVLALTHGRPLEDALRIACAVGAAAVESPAAQPPFAPLESYAAGTPR